VLGRFGEVVEARRTREGSFCCGAGGGQMFLAEEKGKRVKVERGEELVATDARTIATPVRFARRCFAMQWAPWRNRFLNCWTLRRLQRRRSLSRAASGRLLKPATRRAATRGKPGAPQE